MKIISITLFAIFLNVPPVHSAPSRIECLERIGNTATKSQLDLCVNGEPSTMSNSSQIGAIDSSSEEVTCYELGFKKKTQSYANCVVELLGRRQSAGPVNSSDPDASTCLRYGYKVGTNEYAMCRQQIDMARQDAQRQIAQIKRQTEAQQDQQSRAAGLALFNLGMGTLATGSIPGYGPTPQIPPQNFMRTYTLPGGKTMSCTTTGTVTNCF